MLFFVSLSVGAQDFAAVLHMKDNTKKAVAVSNLDSINLMPASQVDQGDFIAGTSKWKGKRIGFLGNSITEYGEYVRAYQKLTDCEALNYGVSATHMAMIEPAQATPLSVAVCRWPKTWT